MAEIQSRQSRCSRDAAAASCAAPPTRPRRVPDTPETWPAGIRRGLGLGLGLGLETWPAGVRRGRIRADHPRRHAARPERGGRRRGRRTAETRRRDAAETCLRRPHRHWCHPSPTALATAPSGLRRAPCSTRSSRLSSRGRRNGATTLPSPPHPPLPSSTRRRGGSFASVGHPSALRPSSFPARHRRAPAQVPRGEQVGHPSPRRVRVRHPPGGAEPSPTLPRPFPDPSPTLPARSPSCSLLSQLHSPPRYVHDYPVEQLYRDNRLNMIHEGST